MLLEGVFYMGMREFWTTVPNACRTPQKAYVRVRYFVGFEDKSSLLCLLAGQFYFIKTRLKYFDLYEDFKGNFIYFALSIISLYAVLL